MPGRLCKIRPPPIKLAAFANIKKHRKRCLQCFETRFLNAGLGQGRLGLQDNRLKRGRFMHGQIGQNLPVNFDSR